MGIAALVFGIVGIISAMFPPLGFLFCVVGLIMAIIVISRSSGERTAERKKAVIGLVLCLIGLVLNVVMVFTGMVVLWDLLLELAQGYSY
ncbi:hypothetical protein ACFLUD_01720 [Chloroflexota bacterium]